jgi:membrane-anchored protein YejM (alkaline phosphatase superfamily)
MSDLLRIVLDTGLFFVSCTVIFVVGFMVDAWVHSRRRATAREAGGRSSVRRTSEGEPLGRAPTATA